MRAKRAIALVILALVVSVAVGCAQATDATITGTIKTKLAADGRVRAFEINVDTTSGVVTLIGERIDDAGITMRVKPRLLDDSLVKGLQIDVDTRDSVVFLTGSVGSEAERKQAIEIARTTEGVTHVEANLR